MAARIVPDAFASLPLTGKDVTADDVLKDPTCVQRLQGSLSALVEALRPL